MRPGWYSPFMTGQDNQDHGGGAVPRSYLRQFITGASGESFSQFVTIVTQLVLVPALLLLWGQERLGVWLILSAVPTYLTLGDLGLTAIFGNEITARRVAGDASAVEIAVHTSWYTTRAITMFGIVLAIGLTLIAPSFIPSLESHPETDTRLAVLLLSLSVCATLAQGTVGASMRVVGLSGIMSATNAAARLAENAALLLVAAFSPSMALAALAMFLARSAVLATNALVFLRHNPEFRPNTALAERRLIWHLMPASAGYFSFTLGNAVLVQTPAILIGNLISPTAVVAFTAARTLARMGRMLVSIVNYAIEPIFTQIASGRSHLLNRTTKLHRNAVMASALVYYVCSLLIGPTFLFWWTHGVSRGYDILYYLLVTAVLFEIVWVTIQVPFVSVNRHAAFGWFYLFIAIITVAATYVLIPLYGVNAAAAAIVICNATFLIYSIYRARNLEIRIMPIAR